MAAILKSTNLSVSADAAWEIVDRFMRADIRVFSFILENRIEGDLRTVVSEGLEQPELNITIDPEQRYASYTLVESAYWKGTFHHGCMRSSTRATVAAGSSGTRTSLRVPGWWTTASTWKSCGLNWSTCWRPARKPRYLRLPPPGSDRQMSSLTSGSTAVGRTTRLSAVEVV